MRQEIIVYRSPVEAWWWDHPEAIVNVLVVMAIAVVVIVIYGWLFGNRRR